MTRCSSARYTKYINVVQRGRAAHHQFHRILHTRSWIIFNNNNSNTVVQQQHIITHRCLVSHEIAPNNFSARHSCFISILDVANTRVNRVASQTTGWHSNVLDWTSDDVVHCPTCRPFSLKIRDTDSHRCLHTNNLINNNNYVIIVLHSFAKRVCSSSHTLELSLSSLLMFMLLLFDDRSMPARESLLVPLSDVFECLFTGAAAGDRCVLVPAGVCYQSNTTLEIHSNDLQ